MMCTFNAAGDVEFTVPAARSLVVCAEDFHATLVRRVHTNNPEVTSPHRVVFTVRKHTFDKLGWL